MSDPAPVLASTRFRVLPEGLTAAQRKHMRWLARRGRSWAYMVGWAALCSVVVAATIPNWHPLVLAGGAVGGLAFMIAWSFIAYVGMPLYARRAMKTQPNLAHEWRVDVSERGLRAVTPNQDNFVAWADYAAWSEDARVLLFYQSERLFQFVPKRGLEPGFVDTVRRLAAHKPKR